MEHDPTRLEADSVRIELPTFEDAEAITDVQARTWIATYPNAELGITQEEITERVESRRQKSIDNMRKTIAENGVTKQIIVAKDNGGSIIGFCLGMKGATANHVKAIYVLPEAHGKGVGKALITQTLAWLGDELPVTLGVAKYSASAIGFYEKMGFVLGDDAPVEDTITLASGRRIPEVRMTKAARA